MAAFRSGTIQQKIQNFGCKLKLFASFTFILLSGCGQMYSAQLDARLPFQGGSTFQQSEGAKLYAANCATCHGAIGQSAKRKRTPEQIKGAIGSVSSMSSLKSLSESEIESISVALSTTPLDQLPSSVQFKFQCNSSDQRGIADARMRRLLRHEIANTLRDLLGTTIVNNSTIQAELGVISADVMDQSPNDIAQSHADSHVAAMLNIAVAASDLSFATTADRDRIFGACAANPNDACAQSFIQNFGLKVYRRPLISTEAADLMAYYKASGGIEGLKRVFTRILMSPSLTFHLEFGNGQPGARIRLTDYEVASRISYRTAGTMPDEALFDAVRKGELAKIENVELHVRRLLKDSASAKAKMADFFRYYLQLNTYGSPNVKAGTAEGINVTGLREEMLQETSDYVNHVIWTKKGQFKDLFFSRDVFPRSERMAKILETTIASGSTPTTTTDAHAGILLRPGFLATSAERTNPMHRGAIIRKRILCDTLGAPDPNAVNARLNELGDLSQVTNRERYSQITNVPQCMSCHTSINPVGFALEGYDQLGKKREIEKIFDQAGTVSSTRPLDLRVTNANIEITAPDTLTDAVDLNAAIGGGNKARACFTQMVFEHQRARPAAIEDQCALAEIERQASDAGTLLDTFVKGVANEDIFWKGL